MLIENQHPLNKSIMVGLIGHPNVGKSSLVNYLMGFDLSAVTDRPQTTRNKFHCTFTVDHTEIILVDTPGLHRSSKEMNIRMNNQAKEGIEGADLILMLLDLTKDWKMQWEELKKLLSYREEKTTQDWTTPCWLVFTKSDLVQNVSHQSLQEFLSEIQQEIPVMEKFFVISSLKGDGVHTLIGDICDRAPFGPHLYLGGEVSNKNERFFVTEYIREQAFQLLKEELPYELAVVIDEYKDVSSRDELGEELQQQRQDSKKGKIVSYISASILVNRPSQRAIVVGSKGSMIKEIGIRARKKIEALVNGPVHLNLHVKVSPHWYKNNFVLEELGLPRAPQSKRVWRKK